MEKLHAVYLNVYNPKLYTKLSRHTERDNAMLRVTEYFVKSLKSQDHSRSFEMVKFKSLGTVFYLHSTVTMALSCIISKIKRHIGHKLRFFHNHAVNAPVMGV